MTSNGQSIALAVFAALVGVAFFALNVGSPVTTITVVSAPPAAAAPPPGAGPASRPETAEKSAAAENEKEDSAGKTEWRRRLAQPASAERDAALAGAWLQLRAASPDAATQQFLALEPVERVSIVATTLAAAASRSSDEAVRDAIRFCDEDPAYALDYGRSLISALVKTGDYPAALSFVLAEDSVDGWLGENGHKWLTLLFTSWAAAAPKQAMQAAQESIGANYRGEALQVVSAVWAKTDPPGAVNFTWQLPASPDRDRALAIALRQWSDADPAAAGAWLASKKDPAP
jgi:hypothetical protein